MENIYLNNKIDSIIQNYMDVNDIPGLAIGIVDNNEIVYENGFGVTSIETNENVDCNTLFHMASVSKTFVATAIMKLAEQEKLNIDKSVLEYVPYFKLNDKRYNNITIRQILSHLSGMPDVNDYEWENPQFDDDSLEKYVKSLNNEKLLWNPGENFAYSNMAYDFLGDVISKVSHMTFEEYMKVNIFYELEMKNTTYLLNQLPIEMLAKPHIKAKGKDKKVSEIFPYNRIHAPSSTLYSNVKEMCNYAIMYLNGGIFNEKIILKNHTYKNMIKPYFKIHNSNESIGLSWFIEEKNDTIRISHLGKDTGFSSSLIIEPERKRALISMINCDYSNISNFTDLVFN